MRVLCLILASDTDPLYVKFQQRWKRILTANPNVTCLFYKGNPDLTDEFVLDGDTIWVRSRESIDTLYDKTILAFRASLPFLDSYDYVFRSNLSTVVSFSDMLAFCETLPRTNCCGGFPGGIPPEDEVRYGLAPKFQFPAGNGFLLSPDVVRRLATDPPPLVIQDDVTIGVALRKWNIPIVQFARYGYSVPGTWYCDNAHLLPPGHTSLDPLPIAFTYRMKSDDRDLDIRLMDDLLHKIYGETGSS